MNQALIRRISGAVVLLAFFFPMVDFGFFWEMNGIEIIKTAFEFEDEDLIIVAIAFIVVMLLALLVIIIPKIIPVTLMLCVGVLIVTFAFMSQSEIGYFEIGYGFYIMIAGLFVSVVSFFVKNNNVHGKNSANYNQVNQNNLPPQGNMYVQPMNQMPPNQIPNIPVNVETAATINDTQPKFCRNCGNKLRVDAAFCSSCGMKI